jgi:serine/threonine-protein kinase
VALKVVRRSGPGSDDVVRKFLNGAIAAAEVNHTNVVRIHRVGLDSVRGVHYVVMEHLKGRTLQAILEESGPMPPSRVVPMLLEVCDGLHAAHSLGVIHRDIKPDNLMRTEDGVVKITDLGLARRITKDPRTTRVMGTAHFMAPEQFEGKGMDPRSDIFALGVTAYYLLSGSFPFAGKNPMQVIYSILTGEPKSLLELQPHTPPRLWAIIRRMIDRSPAARPETVDEVAVELRAVLRGLEETASP